MEARERLISIAGHELRAPLQVLVLEIDVLLAQQRESVAIAVEKLEAIRHQAVHVAELVSSLLDLRQVDSGTLAISLEELDLAEVVRAVIAQSDDLRRSGSQVEVDIRPTRGRWDRSADRAGRHESDLERGQVRAREADPRRGRR